MPTDVTLTQLSRIRLTRDDLERFVAILPIKTFDLLVVKCMVKVLLEEEHNSRVYRIAQITGVENTAASYKFGNSAVTDKSLVLDFGIFKMAYQMNTVSNSEFTQEEFTSWLKACNNKPNLTGEEADDKHRLLNKTRADYPEIRRSPTRANSNVAAVAPSTGTGTNSPLSRDAGITAPMATVANANQPPASSSGVLPVVPPINALTSALHAEVDAFITRKKLGDRERALLTEFASLADDIFAKERRQSQAQLHALQRQIRDLQNNQRQQNLTAAQQAGTTIPSDLDSLSLSELRKLLATLECDKKRVCEKIDEKSKCVVCMQFDAVMILIPCKHQVLCEECSVKIKDCPMCRSPITDKIRPFTP